MSKSLKVKINSTNTVTLYITEKDSWGSTLNKRQVTFNRRQFERALREAEITVPWSAVNR